MPCTSLSYSLNHGAHLPKRNFGFEKRQKEQARQAKKKEKMAEREQRRQERAASGEAGAPVVAPESGTADRVASED